MNCDLCRAPVNDAAVCVQCIRGLEKDLGDVEAISRALVDVFTRQTRRGGNGGSRSAETAVPFDARASNAAHHLRTCLTTWVRELDMGDAPDHGTSPKLAAWLLARSERIRHHAEAAFIVGDIGRRVGDAVWAVDRAKELVFCGQCVVGCDEWLYAELKAPQVTCRRCDRRHDVSERREALRAALNDYLVSASEVTGVCAWIGEIVKFDRVRKWVERGRLLPHGVTLDGRPTYRIGDVRDLLEADFLRQASRRKTA